MGISASFFLNLNLHSLLIATMLYIEILGMGNITSTWILLKIAEEKV